jgi:hypothetical protein
MRDLDSRYYQDLDNAVKESGFWEYDNNPDDYEFGQIKGTDIDVSQTEAANALGYFLIQFFKGVDRKDPIIVAVESPDPDENPNTVLRRSKPGAKVDVSVGAEAMIDDKDRRIIILYLATWTDEFDVEEIDQDFMIKSISTAIRHEIIHLDQYEKRAKNQGLNRKDAKDAFEREGGFGEREDDEGYYGSYMELDAYSHEIAEELLIQLGSAGALRALRSGNIPTNLNISKAAQFYLTKSLQNEKLNNKFLGRVYSQIQELVDKGVYESIIRRLLLLK